MFERRYDIANPDHPAAGPQRIPRPESWKPGTPRRWRRPTDARVNEVLSALPPVDPTELDQPGDMRPSAVLALLAPSERGDELLLTRRSLEMNNHSGEVSFAGGRLDPGENATDAALREAYEEVGLNPDLVTVHGELGHFGTWASMSYIVPVVATVERPLTLRPQTGEVDRVFWVPLSDLTRPGVHHSERWWFDKFPIEERERDIHFFELFEPYQETVWGATARMLVDLLDRL